MYLSFFKKIDRKQYPKIVQKWSFSAYIGIFVFAIGNKLYEYFILSLIFFLINFSIIFFNLAGAVFTIIYFISNAANLIVVLYLILYGRTLAWEKLGYNNIEQDIVKFKIRQKKILFWAWVYFIISTSISLYLALNNPNWFLYS